MVELSINEHQIRATLASRLLAVGQLQSSLQHTYAHT